MGWFDEQIRERLKEDESFLDEAYVSLSSVLSPKKAMADLLNNSEKQTNEAINSILKFFSYKSIDIPKEKEEFQDKLEYTLEKYSIANRTVTLRDDWYKTAIGPMIAITTKDEIVALIPKTNGGYTYYNASEGKTITVNKNWNEMLLDVAISFYKPLPNHSLEGKDLVAFMVSCIRKADVIWITCATLMITLLGFLTPYATNIIFDVAIPNNEQSLLLPLTALLIGGAIGSLCITIIKNLLIEKTVVSIGTATESALVARLISLPSKFFREYSSGELANRAATVTVLSQVSVRMLFSVGFSVLFSLLYLYQIFTYTPTLLLPASVIIFTHLIFIICYVWLQTKYDNLRMNANAKLEGMSISLFSGIEKLKLAGAEKRLFAHWLKKYTKVASYTYNPPLLVKIGAVIPLSITTLGMFWLYDVALQSNIAVADFMAFLSSFGMVTAILATIIPAMKQLAMVKPTYNLIEPILKEMPEIQGDKKRVERLSGAIELEKVSFRYQENAPYIIDNLSVSIKSGEYVAIVGSTGSGKSTLLRLLLGFETPQKGAVYYDKKVLTTLEPQSLRRNIGVVLQESRLLQGSVYDNIAVSCKNLSEEDAWKALEDSGLAEDVREMPMGLETVLSDGSGGISGGQKQRLMIARAIAPKPRLLILDEATSALDNITQKKISESLDKMRATRIIIAHRLSTIRQCNRILVLQDGRIVADGSYDQLLEENEFFQELVARQSL